MGQSMAAALRFRKDSPEAWSAINEILDVDDLREADIELFQVAMYEANPDLMQQDYRHPYDMADIEEGSVRSCDMQDAQREPEFQLVRNRKDGKHNRKETAASHLHLIGPSRKSARTHKQPREYWMQTPAPHAGSSGSGTDTQPAADRDRQLRQRARHDTSKGTSSRRGLCGAQ